MGKSTHRQMVTTLVGAGNLATNLGIALRHNGHEVRQVWSRTEGSARELAKRLNCKWTTDIGRLETVVDVVVVSVKDDALEQVARQIPPTRALVVHTAGSMPLSILPQEKAGVLYPMQTFSKTQEVDFSQIPIFIETRQEEDLHTLCQLAESLSPKVYTLDSKKRRHLHLAAVFACNFTNHCYTLAADLLAEDGIPFDVMLPLIDETAQKVHRLSPREAQTGPAVRWDEKVMERQMAMLPSEREREIYRLMSQSIREKTITKRCATKNETLRYENEDEKEKGLERTI